MIRRFGLLLAGLVVVGTACGQSADQPTTSSAETSTPSTAPSVEETLAPTSPTSTIASTTTTVAPESPWVELARMLVPRSEFQAVAIDERIYAVGGIAGAGSGPAETFDTLEIYDIASDAWSVGAPMPAGRHHLLVAAHGEDLYVFGGLAPLSWATTDTVWRYRTDENVWDELESAPAAMASGVALTIADVIYVIPGVGSSQTLWAFRPADGSWEELASPTHPRDHLSATVLDGRIYLTGGRWSISGELASAEVYDPALDAWTAIESMVDRRSGHAMAAHDGLIYAIGGELLTRSVTLRSVEVYDPAADAWRLIDELDGPIHGTSAVTVGDAIYLVGGAATVARANATGELLRLDP